MMDVPMHSDHHLHDADSGELPHNSIHDRDNHHSSSEASHNSQADAHLPPTSVFQLQKPLDLSNGSSAPQVAVQVVDRLRWWRVRRVREQPLPVNHFVFRNNYTNYSSFGTRPLAPGVARLLSKARTIRTQYLRHEQYMHRRNAAVAAAAVTATGAPQVAMTPTAASSASPSEAEPQRGSLSHPQPQAHSQHHDEAYPREESDLLDNKRNASSTALSPPTPAAAAAPARSSVSTTPTQAGAEPASTTTAAVACGLADTTAPSAVAARLASDVPNLNPTALGISPLSESLTFAHCPTEQEAKDADRLLTLYRPRASSVPVRSRRQRHVAGHGNIHHDHPVESRSTGAHTAQAIQMTRVPTSDDITDVCRVSGAADAVVVLHHAPRLILYEKGMNPRSALRAARASSEALEGLRDAAAENSAEVFALTNLPLSGFERFFYLQQLRDPDSESGATAAAVIANTGTDVRGPSTTSDSTLQSNSVISSVRHTPHPNASTNVVEADHDLARMTSGYGVVNPDDTLYCDSVMTIASPTYSTSHHLLASRQCCSQHHHHHQGSGIAEGLQRASNQSWSSRHRRHIRKVNIRAVSVPCLPRVYRDDYPELQTAGNAAGATPSAHHRTGSQHHHNPHHQRRSRPYLLSSALRSSASPQDAAHLCQRVDDLQDVYVFNPVVDAIGKGAFSKVYAAVPILRGRDGMRRFRAGDEAHEREGSGRVLSPHALSPSMSLTTQLTDPASAITTGTCAEGTGDCNAREVVTGAAARRTAATASLRSVPVVALKVIPRKARQHPPKSSSVVLPFSLAHMQQQQQQQQVPPNTPAPEQPAQQDQNEENHNVSVRRELVEIEREVSILRRLHHSGCSQFYEAVRSPDAFVIAMRMYPGSMDARHYLSRYGAPSQARTALMLFQLVSTVHYLHVHFGLIHRDIKLENLLLSEASPGVTDAQIREVLGDKVHKTDATAAEEDHDLFGWRRSPFPAGGAGATDCAADPSHTTTTLQPGSSSSCSATHEVRRLLRTTLIDFGLARRTRTTAMSSNMSRFRGNGGTCNNSMSASLNSPLTLAAFPGMMNTNTGAAMSAAVSQNGNSNHHGLVGASTLPSIAASAPTTPALGASAVSSQHQPQQHQQQQHQQQQHPQQQPPFTGVGGATFASTISANNSYAAMSAVSLPPLPPMLRRRSPSTNAIGRLTPSVLGGAGATGAAGGRVSVGNSLSRMGMPSPMPSTANMFTRFLDTEEEMDEDDYTATNGTSTATAHPLVCTNAVQGTPVGEPSISSVIGVGQATTGEGRPPFANVGSGASSTDVSASETGSETGTEVEEGDDEGVEELESNANQDGREGVSNGAVDPAIVATAAAEDLPAVPAGPPQFKPAAPIGLPPTSPSSAYAPSIVNDAPSMHSPPRPPLLDRSLHTFVTNTPNTPAALYHRPPLQQPQPQPQLQSSASLQAQFTHASFYDDTESTLLLTPCGTEKYLPPEVLSWILERGWVRRSTTVGLARAMDMYAIGIVAYVLLSGCFPFNASSRATLVQQQQRVPRCNSARWSSVSSEAIWFVQRLLEPNPLKRMTAKEALEHPFLLEARELAEKLSLVPRGEGEEEMPGDRRGRTVSTGGNGSTNNTNMHAGGSGAHGAVGGNPNNSSSLRSHWSSPMSATRLLPPSPTFVERSRLGDGVFNGSSSSNGHPNRPPSFTASPDERPPCNPHVAAPVNGNGFNPLSVFPRTRSASTSMCGFVPIADAVPTVPEVRDNNAAFLRPPGSAGGAILHYADSTAAARTRDNDDAFAAVAQDVLGHAGPRRDLALQLNSLSGSCSPYVASPRLSPSPAATGTATAAAAAAVNALATPSPPAFPAETSAPAFGRADALRASETVVPAPTSPVATSPRPPPVVPAKATSTFTAAVTKPSASVVGAAPPPPSATAAPTTTRAGGDDLFESLYNNIMFSD